MKKFLLLLCIVFVVVCYGYPCFILPFGEYKGKTEILGISQEASFNFKFDGTVKLKSTIGSTSVEKDYFYQLKGNTVVISVDKTFDETDSKIQINNMYKLGELTNTIGMIITIGVGVLATALVMFGKKDK